MNIRKKITPWIPVLIWMLVIFAFSSRPTLRAATIDWQDFIIRKMAHFVEYFILFALNYRALLRSTSLSKRQAILLAFGLGLIYAFSDEYHQTLVPGREGRFRDVFIDSLGLLSSGALLLHISTGTSGVDKS